MLSILNTDTDNTVGSNYDFNGAMAFTMNVLELVNLIHVLQCEYLVGCVTGMLVC